MLGRFCIYLDEFSLKEEVVMFSYIQTGQLLANYDRLDRSVRMRLLDRYHAKLVWGVLADARLELARLNPKIPNIGKGHVRQFNLDTSVMILALYRALKKYSFSLPESVHVINDIYEAYLTRYPLVFRRAYRRYYFSQYHRDRLRHEAITSQLCRYPDDWVFTFLDGDGVTFDFGIDISKCAIEKLYRSQNADEFTPYVCHLDHAVGKMLGLGFTRQDTLVNGAAVCDCRWKLGAATPGWLPSSDMVLQDSFSKLEVSI
jgi:hypothetical protein